MRPKCICILFHRPTTTEGELLILKNVVPWAEECLTCTLRIQLNLSKVCCKEL